MKKIITILCFAFLANLVNAQAKWTYVEVNDSVNNGFKGVYFTSETNGVIVGQNGMIKRSTDGGKTWTVINSGQTSDLNNVYFIDANTGWAVGTQGIVIKTTNGGLTWSNSSGSITSDIILKDVKFLDQNTGYVTGSQVLKTTNGGSTWTALTTSASFKQSIDMVNANNGYICGNGGLLGNTINGTNFFGQTSPVGNNIYKIRFINDSTGVAVGQSNLILHTKNKGVTWTLKSTASTKNLFDICAVGASTFWAAGDKGLIQKSTDAGNSWTTITNSAYNQGNEVLDLHFVNENLGWFVGPSGVYIYDNRPSTNIETLNNKTIKFSVFPNPNTGIFNITDLENDSKITITDYSGKTVFETIYSNNETTINLSHLNKGVYFIKVSTDKHLYQTQKIMIN